MTHAAQAVKIDPPHVKSENPSRQFEPVLSLKTVEMFPFYYTKQNQKYLNLCTYLS